MRLTKTEGLLPVGVLTGFLGSGKTTLLRRILEAEQFGDSAILINEFGETGLDHILVGEIAPDVVLLNSGCLCCTLRGELRDALADLLNQRLRGDIPPFRRVIMETSGLAQPSLILSTVFADPLIRHHYGIGETVTCVDALNALEQAAEEPVWTDQAAAADQLIITKTDLAGAERAARVLELLEHMNPLAFKQDVNSPGVLELFSQDGKAGKAHAQLHGLKEPPQAAGHSSSDVFTLRLVEESPLDWEAFGVWLSMLLHAHGDKIKRVKGLLNLRGSEGPVVLQGVSHVIHPPEHLEAWGDMAPQTDLVFIMRGIRPEQVRDSFEAFVLGR